MNCKIRVWLFASVGAVLVCILTGCGGGGSGPETGTLSFWVDWPDKDEGRGRLIPELSQSIKFELFRGENQEPEQSVVVVRPNKQATLNDVFAGPVLLRATAYPNANATGTPLAKAEKTIKVIGGQTTTERITLVSTIDHLEISPASPSVKIGKSVQLTVTAKDAKGNLVLIAVDKLEWRSSDSWVATVDSDGLVTGVANGSTEITVTETESGKSATVTAAVKSAGPGSVIATIPVGNRPFKVAVNPTTNRIYVTNLYDDTVSVIDGVTNTVVANCHVGDEPASIAVNPTTNRIYVVNGLDDTVSVLDGVTNEVVDVIPLDSGLVGIAVNPVTNRIYVASWWHLEVSVIDGVTNTVITTIPVGSRGNDPNYLAVNPTTNRIYVAEDSAYSEIVVIDGSTNRVIDTIPIRAGPFLQEVAINPATNLIYLLCSYDESVIVFDADIGTQEATITVAREPYAVAVDPDTNRVYVANKLYDGLVTVIDGVSNQVIGTISVGDNPYGVAVNSTTNRIYTANCTDNTVTVIDGNR